MSSDLASYQSLLKMSASSAISFAVLGFILSIIVCFILLKKKLLVRHIPIWNAASKLIYLITILGTTAIFGLYGFVYGTQKNGTVQVEQELLGAAKMYAPSLIGYMGDKVRNHTPSTLLTAKEIVEASIDDIRYRPESDSTFERFKAKIINDYLLKEAANEFGIALQTILIQRVQLLGSALKENDFRGQENGELAKFSVDLIKKLTTDSLIEVDFTAIDRNVPQLLVDAAMRMINRIFVRIYIYLTLILLVLIGLISAEIYIYRHYYMMDVIPLDEVKPTEEIVLTQKRISTTKDGLKVFFGSWFVFMLITTFVIMISSVVDKEAESAIGWWLIGVAEILSIIVCPLVLFTYIYYRRNYKSHFRPLQILSVFAISLIIFRIMGVSYLQGMRGSIGIAVFAVLFIWYILFLICLTVFHFMMRNKKVPLDNAP